jgi:hypothetical protein
VELGIVGSASMHRLPQAARVRLLGGDRQSQWGKQAYQQQDQQ